jgi:hypothetical protein
MTRWSSTAPPSSTEFSSQVTLPRLQLPVLLHPLPPLLQQAPIPQPNAAQNSQTTFVKSPFPQKDQGTYNRRQPTPFRPLPAQRAKLNSTKTQNP